MWWTLAIHRPPLPIQTGATNGGYGWATVKALADPGATILIETPQRNIPPLQLPCRILREVKDLPRTKRQARLQSILLNLPNAPTPYSPVVHILQKGGNIVNALDLKKSHPQLGKRCSFVNNEGRPGKTKSVTLQECRGPSMVSRV